MSSPGAPERSILVLLSGGLELPASTEEATIESCARLDEDLASILRRFGPATIRRVFRGSSSADTTLTTPEGDVVRLPDLAHVFEITISDSTGIPSLLQDLAEYDSTVYVEHNSFLRPRSTPDDPCYDDYQWHLNNTCQQGEGLLDADIDAPEAWDITEGSPDVSIAILDTGVDRTFNDLRIVYGDDGFDNPWLPHHGTWVTTILGAATNNGIAAAGVDRNCTLISEWLDPYTVAEAAAAFYSAIDRGAHILLCPWTATDESSELETLRMAVKYAAVRGAAVVAPMGNDGMIEMPFYPAAFTTLVTAVGATDKWDRAADDTNLGSYIDVAAPGVLAWLSDPTVPNHLHKCDPHSGSSYSAAITAGVMGLMKGYKPDLCPDDLEQVLERTADDIEDPGFDIGSGWGRINARRALEYVRDRYVEHRLIESPQLSVYAVSDWYQLYWESPPNFRPSGTYSVRRYELRGSDSFLHAYQEPPVVWPRAFGTEGMNDANPQAYDWRWARLVSQSADGFVLGTYVYEVQTWPDQQAVGWWPVSPGQCRIAYSVVGRLDLAGTPAGSSSLKATVRCIGQNPAKQGREFTIEVCVPEADRSMISVMDVSGRAVRRVFHGALQKGTTRVVWDGCDEHGRTVGSGVYFVRVDLGARQSRVLRLIVLN